MNVRPTAYSRFPTTFYYIFNNFSSNQSWDLFKFNYANGESVEKEKILWKREKTYKRKNTQGSAQVDMAAVLQCNDCYAHLTAGFEFEMVIKATSGAIPIGLDRK
jgi:hypothetical protein